MGAWGSGTFDDGDAWDWVVELAEADDLSPIESAIAFMRLRLQVIRLQQEVEKVPWPAAKNSPSS